EHIMRLLIKRALVVDPQSSHHKKRLDLFVRNGNITRIGRNLKEQADHVIESGNLHVSTGWVDIGTQVGEPGFEQREELATVAAAAVSGGYTTLACFPNTDPPLHSKSEIEYIRNRSQQLPVDIHPIGAISRECAGDEIAEMQDMSVAGAIAFSDGRYPIQNSGLMLRSLQYVRTFDGLIINRPQDALLAPEGQLHESKVSAMLGLRGIPGMVERIMLERDLRLLEYSGSRLLTHAISAAECLSLIRGARRNGLRVHASTPAVNLLLADESLMDFNTNLKVLPPLRSRADQRALIRGIKDGTISCICSNHEPVEEEHKKVEFAHAAFGASALETAFAMACTALKGKMKIEELVHCFTSGPCEILGLDRTAIQQDIPADLTLFDPDIEWSPSAPGLKTRSKNDAALGQVLRGKAVGVVTKGRFHRNAN
ncbi:MAG: dihydroorotase, partial [Saprospiraceae bacterium]|nr:dihydroorotase [Saprospiraceae bacterium]